MLEVKNSRYLSKVMGIFLVLLVCSSSVVDAQVDSGRRDSSQVLIANLVESQETVPVRFSNTSSIGSFGEFLIQRKRSQTSPESIWKRGKPVMVVSSASRIPEFPSRWGGYAPMAPGLDFWGQRFKTRGSERVFEGDREWTRIEDGVGNKFPKSMNGCWAGLWLMRWRSSNDEVVVEAAVGYIGDVKVVEYSRDGRYGYMMSSNCYEPLFRFKKAINGNPSGLVDVLYEIKFFEARP